VVTNPAQAVDPYAVLGVAAGASDAEIRTAYLTKLRAFPPDRAPEAFERVRDAYARLREPEQRARWVLEADPFAPLPDLLRRSAPARRFVGLEPWLDALRRR